MSFENIPDDERVAGDALNIAFAAVAVLLASTVAESLLLGIVGIGLLAAGAAVTLVGAHV